MKYTRQQYHDAMAELEARRYALRNQLLEAEERDEKVNLIFKISMLAAVIAAQDFIAKYLTDDELSAVQDRFPDISFFHYHDGHPDISLDDYLVRLDEVEEGHNAVIVTPNGEDH